MKIDLSQFRETFQLESADHIATMEAGLLQLRSTPGDIELLNSIFRSAHSIKGGAGIFELTSLVRFTHSLENLLDRMRAAEIQATEEVIGLLLRAVDVLNLLLEDGAELPAEALELERRFAELAPCEAVEAKEVAPEAPTNEKRELRLYKVDFRPNRDFFSSGNNPVMMLRNLAMLGTVSCCQLHTEELPPLAEMDLSQCYLSWTMELASTSPQAELQEVFEFVEHLAEIRIQCVEAKPALEAKPAPAPPIMPEPAKEAEKKSSSGGDSSSVRVAIEKAGPSDRPSGRAGGGQRDDRADGQGLRAQLPAPAARGGDGHGAQHPRAARTGDVGAPAASGDALPALQADGLRHRAIHRQTDSPGNRG